MRVGRKCSVCTHEKHDQIDRELLEGKAGLRNIAERFGVGATCLHRHRHQHLSRDLAHAATQKQERAQGELLEHAICEKKNRLGVLHDMRERLITVAQERGRDMADVPGGETGLLVRKVKSVGQGEAAREVEEYAVDGVLLREIREYQQLAANEMGELGPGSERAASGPSVVVMVVPSLPSQGYRAPMRPVEIDVPGRLQPALPEPEAETILDGDPPENGEL